MAASGHVTLEMPPQRSARADLDLTVVICTRDRASGLYTTLASLQHQTDSNFRVLVVENGRVGGIGSGRRKGGLASL